MSAIHAACVLVEIAPNALLSVITSSLERANILQIFLRDMDRGTPPNGLFSMNDEIL